MGDCEEVAHNQLRANQSWRQIFTEIVYFGPHEPVLAGAAVQFIPCDPFPPISALALAASMGGNWACLINADIVISSNLMSAIPEAVRTHRARAITSRRWQIEPWGDLENSKLVDFGYDFFLAERSLWLDIARKVPAQYRIGHAAWDTWVMGYFNKTVGRQFVDITSRRCIFHPRHENRHQPYTFQVVEDQYGHAGGMPLIQL